MILYDNLFLHARPIFFATEAFRYWLVRVETIRASVHVRRANRSNIRLLLTKRPEQRFGQKISSHNLPDKCARFWHAHISHILTLPQTLFKTQAVIEGFWLSFDS